MSDEVSESDPLVLVDERGERIPLVAGAGLRKVQGLGVYDPGELVGKGFFEKITIGNRTFMILPPSIYDKIQTIQRKAQIILPKDGLFIIYHSDIKPGDHVVEAGVGSGSLTIMLANFVRPQGRVISYDIREEFIKIAQKNIERAGFGEFVEIKKQDVTKSIPERDVDAVILDIPNPWDAVKNAHGALRQGGHIACYSPTINQVEKTVGELRNMGFFGVKTLETMQREMVVGERGSRPSFDALGHTGYVTCARKIQ